MNIVINNTDAILDLDTARAELTKFAMGRNSDRAVDKEEQSGFEVAKQSRLYARLGEAYGLALRLFENEEVYTTLLTEKGIAREAEGANPFGPFIRLAFRTFGKNAKSEPDSSAWKYGNSLRYFRDMGWHPNEVADKLPTVEHTINGVKYTKLRATELYDRAKYKEDEEKQREAQNARDHFLSQPAELTVPTISLPKNVKWKKGDIVALWGTIDSAGEISLRGPLTVSTSTLHREVQKQADSAYKRHREELFRKLEEHDARLEIREAELKAREKMQQERETEFESQRVKFTAAASA